MKLKMILCFALTFSFIILPITLFAGKSNVRKIYKIVKQAEAVMSAWDSIFGKSGVDDGVEIRECDCWGADYTPPKKPECKSGYVAAFICENAPLCVISQGYTYYQYYQYGWICTSEN
ncbi:MAG: hypothetical protein PVI90_14540 [Desulfobacteraceae bacterium]|jgi:hypothetical protein